MPGGGRAAPGALSGNIGDPMCDGPDPARTTRVPGAFDLGRVFDGE
jgi:hypothetical protein